MELIGLYVLFLVVFSLMGSPLSRGGKKRFMWKGISYIILSPAIGLWLMSRWGLGLVVGIVGALIMIIYGINFIVESRKESQEEES